MLAISLACLTYKNQFTHQLLPTPYTDCTDCQFFIKSPTITMCIPLEQHMFLLYMLNPVHIKSVGESGLTTCICSNESTVYKYAEGFQWFHGKQLKNIQKKHVKWVKPRWSLSGFGENSKKIVDKTSRKLVCLYHQQQKWRIYLR